MSTEAICVCDAPVTYGKTCNDARTRGLTVAIVPTMGALHEGHFALIREARKHAEFVVVSVFVNPTQFAPGEDMDRYPRTLERDIAGCGVAGANCVFVPTAADIYPHGECTRVHVDALTGSLCGLSRRGHFTGVATVVAKLLMLTGPCVAVFGRKDYQQLKVVERMVRDLFIPARIVGMATVREPDGLAMSSRNRYLNSNERQLASAIPRALSLGVRAFGRGERLVSALRSDVARGLGLLADSLDYLEVADADNLTCFSGHEFAPDRALMALAVRVGPARLIDNVLLGDDGPPVIEQLSSPD